MITTSWDDGHTLDMRLAERLSFYGIPGTFYVCLNPPFGNALTQAEVCELDQMGMEIGAHTMTHPVLTDLDSDAVLDELVQSKKKLEDWLGRNVSSFSYPMGKFSSRVCSLAANAGYRLARTTVSFRWDLEFDPFCMPVSLQCYPLAPRIHLRHALKDMNVKGLWNWGGPLHFENNVCRLCNMLLERVVRSGGIFHLWGHSWEIGRSQRWEWVERLLQDVAGRADVSYLTNSQVLDNVGPWGSSRDRCPS